MSLAMIHGNSRRTTFPGRRPGAILALVLIALFGAIVLGLALVEVVLVQQRQMHVLARQQQCFWLAEAGVQRATLRIARSPEYTGETWTTPAQVLGTPQPGVVVIQVKTDNGAPAMRQLQIEARLSEGPQRQIVYRRQVTVPAGREASPGPTK